MMMKRMKMMMMSDDEEAGRDYAKRDGGGEVDSRILSVKKVLSKVNQKAGSLDKKDGNYVC